MVRAARSPGKKISGMPAEKMLSRRELVPDNYQKVLKQENTSSFNSFY